MFAAFEGDYGSEHSQPQKQNAGEFIRPDERLLKKIASGNTAEQYDNFRDHEQRCDGRDDRTEKLLGSLQGARHPGHPGQHDAGFLR